jgi:uncharacterized protein
MTEIILAFVTGLTTGGLSCLAVQGGLLASSLAQQVETGLTGKGKQPKLAAPILWFLVAKIAAYTLLGLVLGAIGSVINLTPTARGIFQLAIGVFMIGQALRILNVHPLFRHFNIETPYFIRKYIRSKTTGEQSNFAPALLGALTVFIPCGITQVMLASAVASGNAIFGATLMFAFTLGTSPVFFTISYLATRLGSTLEKYFMKFVAITILLLAFLTIRTGFNLIGWPVFPSAQASSSDSISSALPSSVVATAQAFQTPEPVQLLTDNTQTGQSSSFAEVSLQIVDSGYKPKVLKVPAGKPIRLTISSDGVYSCALSLVIPSQNIEVMMQPTDTQVVEFPAFSAGEKIPFSCSMGMYTGMIEVQ